MINALSDPLTECLEKEDLLFGVICRDATHVDIELIAAAGYKIVWFDREHSSQSLSEMLRLSRTVVHLGMIPLLRVSELSRAQIQTALDGGMQIVTLPNVQNAEMTRSLVSYGKYPPVGTRGVSTTNAGAGYNLDADVRKTLDTVNRSTHLMAMIESDAGYENLDEILTVPECDMITVGPLDWAVGAGYSGAEAREALRPKIEHTIATAVARGKTVATVVLDDATTLNRHRSLGVRIFFVCEDVVLYRRALTSVLADCRAATL